MEGGQPCFSFLWQNVGYHRFVKGPLTVKVPRCIYYIFVYIHLYIYSWLLYIGPLVTFVPSNYLSVVLAVITVLPGKTKEW